VYDRRNSLLMQSSSLTSEHLLRWSKHLLPGYGLGKINQLLDDNFPNRLVGNRAVAQ